MSTFTERKQYFLNQVLPVIAPYFDDDYYVAYESMKEVYGLKREVGVMCQINKSIGKYTEKEFCDFVYRIRAFAKKYLNVEIPKMNEPGFGEEII